MIFLLDTTTNPAAIGIWDGEFSPENSSREKPREYIGKLKTKTIESTPENNRKIVSIIQSFLQSESRSSTSGGPPKLNFGKITAIGVVNGPGAFTGVRTGVTIANSFAYALKIPVYAIDTLTAQISPLPNPKDPNLNNPAFPVQAVSLLSASNTEVYFARFQKGKMIGKIEIVDVANNLKNRLKKGDNIFGDLKGEHWQTIKIQECDSANSEIRIKNLLNLILQKKIRPKKMALPLYIKKPNITMPKKK